MVIHRIIPRSVIIVLNGMGEKYSGRRRKSADGAYLVVVRDV